MGILPLIAVNFLFSEAVGEGAVGVDATVAEEGPVAAGFFLECGVDLCDEDFFFVAGGFLEEFAEGVGDEGAAEEFDAVFSAGGVGDFFEADAVGGGDEDAVGDGVGALDGFPRAGLGFAEGGFFLGVPADGGGVEEDADILQGGEAGGFGVPLVPADEHADAAVFGLEGFETGRHFPRRRG